jgi:hypothetical protein
MRSIIMWLASALMAVFVFTGAGVSQPPDRKDGPVRVRGPGEPGRPGEPGLGRLGADDVVERIMALDKNKDGKVTRDELPERMHDLIARGDTNKDGGLDKDEVKKLATAPGEFGGRVGVGFGPRPARDITVAGVGPGPGPVPGFGGIEGVVEDLKLSDKKKDQALAAVKAHEENVRKLVDQAREDLLRKMKEILSEEELKDFQAALDRPRGAQAIINIDGGPPGAPRPGDMERKLEQLQKELDELRRQLRR